MDKNVLFSIIKEHPQASKNDIENFFEDITEKGLNIDSSYYDVWDIDKTEGKVVYNNICKSNVKSSNVYIISKTIIENKLLLKLMTDGNIQETFLPELLEEIYCAYVTLYEGDKYKKKSNFIYFVANNLPICTIKKLYRSKDFLNKINVDNKHHFYKQLTELLMVQDINSDLVELMVDNYLPDEVDSNSHQMTMEELEEICDK